MGVGVWVGTGVEVGVGVTRRGGMSVTAMPKPMLTTTSRLIIQDMMRIRRELERRTVPPVSDFV